MNYLELLENLLNSFVNLAILLFEYIGVAVITYSGLQGLVNYVRRRSDTRLVLAKGLAMGLEFKLGSEILRTVVVRSMSEIYIVASIVALRAILTILIHWEIKNEEKDKKGEVPEAETAPSGESGRIPEIPASGDSTETAALQTVASASSKSGNEAAEVLPETPEMNRVSAEQKNVSHDETPPLQKTLKSKELRTESADNDHDTTKLPQIQPDGVLPDSCRKAVKADTNAANPCRNTAAMTPVTPSNCCDITEPTQEPESDAEQSINTNDLEAPVPDQIHPDANPAKNIPAPTEPQWKNGCSTDTDMLTSAQPSQVKKETASAAGSSPIPCSETFATEVPDTGSDKSSQRIVRPVIPGRTTPDGTPLIPEDDLEEYI